MKIIKFKNIILILKLVLIITEGEKNDSKNNLEILNKETDYINNDGFEYVLPHINNNHINNHEMILQHRSIIPLNHQSFIRNIIPSDAQMRVQCPCAASVVCKPCNIMIGPADPNMYPLITPAECPCAQINCPVCPPLSLLHEIASKKALQDQELASNLKAISSKMSKYFDLVIKYAGDVVKYEKEAKEAAKNMEESSMKAHFARNNMVNTSEKARFIAKTGIVENRPCGGIDCHLNQSMNPMLGFSTDKVFPEEVDNIRDHIRDSYTANVNGFIDENGNPLSRKETMSQLETKRLLQRPIDIEDDSASDYEKNLNEDNRRNSNYPVQENTQQNYSPHNDINNRSDGQNQIRNQNLNNNQNNFPNNNNSNNFPNNVNPSNFPNNDNPNNFSNNHHNHLNNLPNDNNQINQNIIKNDNQNYINNNHNIRRLRRTR